MNMKIVNVKIPTLDKELFYTISIKDGSVVELVPHPSKVKGERAFSYLQEELMTTNDIVWDGEGRILLPGMVDAHMHLDKSHTLFVAENKSGTLLEAIESYTKASESFTDEQVKERMRKTALGALAHGTTTIRTHIDFNTRVQEETTFRGIRMALELKRELASVMTIQVYPMLPYYPYTDLDRTKIEKMLKMDIDGVGGAPHISEKPLECIDEIFSYAKQHNLPLDLHTDESDDPAVDTVLYIAEKTKQFHYQGKVVVDHLCSLAAMEEQKAKMVIEEMKKAHLGAITLPAANLYLQGRGDTGIIRRGITRVRELLEAGVPIATASDNVCDPFHPFGRGDLLQIAQLTGYTAHLGGKEDIPTLLKMITDIPAKLTGKQEKGIATGQQADFVIIDATSVERLFAELPQTRAVFGGGRWLVSTTTSRHYEVNGSIQLGRG
ncbi:amidohydrolase family protein [Halalkalibacter krulwichiae]|uniref:Cytosine deaminase n=1 Tax=Halalkalibacter krulwichiae TaxID=199441 RepID=A0A1X9MEZ9_9BACI|nr:amidohydrolase family protein [Halalkalibacter krulwichiae]ARK32017.1 Cytosine deaminase [Halalkalibacter krulwichiae]